MIEWKHIRKAFGAKVVLKDFSFHARAGEVVFVLGRSGVGKSVLLKLAAGFISPDAGEILWFGRNAQGFSTVDWRKTRRACPLVFQFPALIDFYTVFENVAVGLSGESKNDEPIVIEALDRVGLAASYLSQLPQGLSLGEQKKVSLARALALKPQGLFFDEPTTGLDPYGAKEIFQTVKRLAQESGLACVVVSHDVEFALEFSDRLVFIEGGEKKWEGAPKQVGECEDPWVLRFLRAGGVSL